MTNRVYAGSVLLLCTVATHAADTLPSAPEWSGQGRVRVLVRVEPVDLTTRPADELVARCPIDFVRIMDDLKLTGSVDLSTLQVQRYDPATGKAMPFAAFSEARTPFDRPCRFEDDEVPWDYPDRANYSSEEPNGRGSVTIRKGGGRLFNREMRSTRGNITWVHTQEAGKPSHYALYWDLARPGDAGGPSPSPWIGDADVLRAKQGQPLGGLAHFTVCTGDFNGDGLFDLMAGTEKGDLMWFPNHGTRGAPKFIGCRMLTDEEGPIDCGWYSAPFMFDWDNDGLLDVLSGTSHNAILWWKNVGSKTEPKLSYRGFVMAGDKRLAVPEKPVPEDTGTIFARDYYNQPWVGDWDGDGTPDIITGSYTTGQISFFKGGARGDDGVPSLTFVDVLRTADGEPIDTVWAASPFVFDVDHDGKPDLLTGAWFWSGILRERRPGEADPIMYYHNEGTREKPVLKRADVPKIGDFTSGEIGRPMIADWNNDGLPDLLVSDASGAFYRFLNEGTLEAPRWRMNSDSLRGAWGFVRDTGFTSMADLDGDGRPEMLTAAQFLSPKGSPHSPEFVTVGRAHVKGKPIRHPGPGYGDPYYYTALTDFDRDGHPDLLWGDQQGYFWLHRHASGTDPYAFEDGVRLKLKDGTDARLGPPVVDSPEKATDFTILQGSRVIFVTADFDRDGIDDLAVTETYGNIWILRNTKAGGIDTFEAPVLVGKVIGGGRSDDLNVVDWNEDGKPDLMIGQTTAKPGTIYLNESTSGKFAFAKPITPLDLPFMFWGASLKAMDWNNDGDQDFLVHSEFYAFFVEKSFLKHGYRMAKVLGAAELRTGEGKP